MHSLSDVIKLLNVAFIFMLSVVKRCPTHWHYFINDGIRNIGGYANGADVSVTCVAGSRTRLKIPNFTISLIE